MIKLELAENFYFCFYIYKINNLKYLSILYNTVVKIKKSYKAFVVLSKYYLYFAGQKLEELIFKFFMT
jgi:hypothetical protein